MTTLITITIAVKDRTEKGEKMSKPGFSEHNLLHISITMGQSRSMMGVILTQENEAAGLTYSHPPCVYLKLVSKE